MGSKIKAAADLLAAIIANPTSARRLPEWTRSLRRSTIDLAQPWLPYGVIDRLETHLDGEGRVFEYGGGGSTLWFAGHAAEVVTVEHNQEWQRVLRQTVGDLHGVTLLAPDATENFDPYVNSIGDFPNDHFDVVVVDGRMRVACAAAARQKVRPGGLLILDDTDRDRYAPAFELLKHWPSHTYRGLTPTKRRAGVTTVWQKPSSS